MARNTADEPILEVVLEKSGRVLKPSEYSYTQDFLDATDSFSFTIYSEKTEDLHGLELQPVELLIDGKRQMLGRIEKTTCGGDQYGSAVHCEGRDYLADLVECNVDPLTILPEGKNLEQAILYLAGPCGITKIEDQSPRYTTRTGKYVNPMDAKLSSKQVKDLRPEAGKGLMDALTTLCARYGVMIQPALERDTVVVQAPSYEWESHSRLVRGIGATKSNLIISGTASRDYSKVPTHCIFTGKQGNASEKGGAKGTMRVWDLFGDWIPVAGDELRSILENAVYHGRVNPDATRATEAAPGGVIYRMLYFLDRHAKTQEQIERSQLRAVSERLKDTLRYEATVRGHVNPQSGYVWGCDTMIDVDDSMTNVHEQLWCHRAVFANSSKNGPTTTLSMIRGGSFMVYADPIENVRVYQKPKQSAIRK